MPNNPSVYTVPAVEKSMAILEYLTVSKKGLHLRDIYTNLDLPKTTTFSILNTLVHCGLVQKNNEGLFLPTLKLYTMGIQVRDIINKQHSFLPYLEDLRDKTGFTVFYAMYDNGEQVVLEKLNGFGSVVFKSYVGERKRMNTSASGKAMAAYLCDAEQKIMFSKGFDQLTPNSIVGKEELLTHLETIRENGYAVDDGEGEVGVRCIGAPVFTHGKRLYGAVSISTLKDNMDFLDLSKYASLVKETAEKISRDLSCKGQMS